MGMRQTPSSMDQVIFLFFSKQVLERQDNYENGNVDYLAHSREDFIQAFNIWRMTQQHANWNKELNKAAVVHGAVITDNSVQCR